MRLNTLRSESNTLLAVIALGALAAGCGGPRVALQASAEASAAVERCGPLGDDEKQACYETLILDELERDGLAAALDMLGSVGAADVDVERDGHVYTHAIGIEAYSPDVPFTDVFIECSTLYQSGCYHGVIQAHFISEGTSDAEAVQELCEPYERDAADRWVLFQCLHGLGHGLTMYYGHDLPRALADCDYLSNNWNRESCYGGAFMENVVHATSPHHPASELVHSPDAEEHDHGEASAEPEDAAHDHTQMTVVEDLEPFEPLRAEDPHYPCSILDDRYLTACYMMQTSAMLWHNGGDIGDTADECANAPQAWRTTCFQSLGRDVSARTLQDPDDALRDCGKSPEEYREWCYVGLVKNFVDLTATTDSGFDFCTRVEDWAKPRCHEAMGEEIGILHASVETRREACTHSETPELERDCRRGARVPGA